MAYNLSHINGSDVVVFTQTVNTVLLDGWLGILFLIAVFVVTLLGHFFSTNDVGKAAVASSLFTFIIAVLFRAMDLVPNLALFITLILFAISVALTWDRS